MNVCQVFCLYVCAYVFVFECIYCCFTLCFYIVVCVYRVYLYVSGLYIFISYVFIVSSFASLSGVIFNWASPILSRLWLTARPCLKSCTLYFLYIN